MNGFIVRVTAYFGIPVQLEKFYTRSAVFRDTVVAGDIDLDTADVVDDFVDICTAVEEEYGCKVNLAGTETRLLKDGLRVVEFDAFEPSWPEQQEAQDVVDDVSRRLVEWAATYSHEEVDDRGSVPQVGA